MLLAPKKVKSDLKIIILHNYSKSITFCKHIQKQTYGSISASVPLMKTRVLEPLPPLFTLEGDSLRSWRSPSWIGCQPSIFPGSGSKLVFIGLTRNSWIGDSKASLKSKQVIWNFYEIIISFKLFFLVFPIRPPAFFFFTINPNCVKELILECLWPHFHLVYCMRQDLNPQPSNCELSLLTTRPDCRPH